MLSVRQHTKRAQEFRRNLQEKMIDSTPQGRIDTVGRGTNFEARFQRSARGQRPAIQTRRLLNSYRAKKTSELSAETSVIAETDEGFDYGDYLQKKQKRQVMTDEDRSEAQASFDNKLERALIKFALNDF